VTSSKGREQCGLDVPLDRTPVLAHRVCGTEGGDVVEPPAQQVRYAARVAFGDLPGLYVGDQVGQRDLRLALGADGGGGAII
jgi:hypothetical protein